MKILLTGGLGFVGSHFLEVAEKAGHQVYILDALTYAGRTRNIPSGWRWWHQCDIADQTLVEHHLRAFKPDAVVNMAAESHVSRSIEKRGPFLDTNVLGTQRLLDACLGYWNELLKPAGFVFLHVSTDEVYGSLGPNDAPWTEDSPYAPNNPYAASKAASDHLVRAYGRTFGLPVITTHSANNYGSRQHPEKLIPTLIRQCLAGEPMTLHGDGEHIRDWLHVSDHCMGLLDVLEMGRLGQVYNFGSECERSNAHIARLIRDLLGSSSEIIWTPDRLGNDRRYAMNNRLVGDGLFWCPRGSIEDRISEVIQWYVDNQDYAATYGR